MHQKINIYPNPTSSGSLQYRDPEILFIFSKVIKNFLSLNQNSKPIFVKK
jgi:hypothetical protein